MAKKQPSRNYKDFWACITQSEDKDIAHLFEETNEDGTGRTACGKEFAEERVRVAAPWGSLKEDHRPCKACMKAA